MAAVIPQEHFHITKGAPTMFARKTNLTKTMECRFCAACGTRLYHVPGGAAYPNRNIKPGTLDDTWWLTPTIHFWTCNAQRWFAFPSDATRHETQPDTLGWTSPRSETHCRFN
jgi:hypothetical protein